MGQITMEGEVLGLDHSALVGGKKACQEVAPADVVLYIERSTNGIYKISMLRALVKFNFEINIECVEAINRIHRLADMFVDDKEMWNEFTVSSSPNEK